MEKYCISIDWLGVAAFQTSPDFAIKQETKTENYVIKHVSDIRNNVFARVLYVYKNQRKVATIFDHPYSSVLDFRLALVKLENRYLYSKGYVSLLNSILDECTLSYHNITRLDLCYDCNILANGMLPGAFIKQYITESYESPDYIKRNSEIGFTVSAKKNASTETLINYIRFNNGTNSRVKMYMYDKTLELKEVKDKPYIRELWKKAGLISWPSSRSGSRHVWRTEISISSQALKVKNKETGQIGKIELKHLENQEDINRLFLTFADKYLVFSIKGAAKRQRDYQRLQLFERDQNTVSRPVYVVSKICAGRTEKVCYNKLKKLALDESDIAFEYRDALANVLSFLVNLQFDRELAHYQYNKMLAAISAKYKKGDRIFWENERAVEIAEKLDLQLLSILELEDAARKDYLNNVDDYLDELRYTLHD